MTSAMSPEVVSYGFCQCGCGERTSVPTATNRKIGRIKGVPMKYKSGHNTRGEREVSYRIEDCGYETPCWVWTGHAVQRGKRAGRVGGTGSKVYSYRYLYEMHKGPIPEGLDLDHLCRNPLCVNPDHLEPVTRQENLRRGAGTKLTQDTADKMRALAASHPRLTQAQIAERFGVAPQTVSDVLRGLRWA